MSKTNKTYYGKEAKRIIKVGTNVGGFVAKIAAKNILGITQKNKNAEELTQLLGNLKGPIMKVAQILSTIPDAIPEEYAKTLSLSYVYLGYWIKDCQKMSYKSLFQPLQLYKKGEWR